ncbi:MAG TPA: NAD-dependent epimerase/dehydratase family protein [Methyloversatilis sp.]
MKVLLTGATGFVGRETGRVLRVAGHEVSPVVRSGDGFRVDRIDGSTDWSGAFDGVQAVIHLAARVHQMNDSAVDPLAAFRAVNATGTERLAREAAAAGVRRFVFVSSVKAVGESSPPGVAIDETTVPRPADPYGISKLEAEKALHQVSTDTGMQVVIVRPPLVYGPGVGANFRALVRAVARGWPLPLACVCNRRSLVAVGNLADALRCCVEHPAAAGRTYFVTDGEDAGTPELCRRIGRALGRPARLLPVPVAFLRLAGTLTGRSAAVARLTGSLVLDSSRIRRELGWYPPQTMDQALTAMVAAEYAS